MSCKKNVQMNDLLIAATSIPGDSPASVNITNFSKHTNPLSPSVNPPLIPKYLNDQVIEHFENSLRTFHVPIKHLACKAEYLEELFYDALRKHNPTN